MSECASWTPMQNPHLRRGWREAASLCFLGSSASLSLSLNLNDRVRLGRVDALTLISEERNAGISLERGR
jgi:hypothetical protein